MDPCPDYLIRDKRLRLLVTVTDGLCRLLRLGLLRKGRPAAVRRILLIKPDHMGDVLFATAVLPHLNRAFPEAGIDMVVGRWTLPILSGNPRIRRKLVVDHPMLDRSDRSSVAKLFGFAKGYAAAAWRILAERYDLVVNLREYGWNLSSLLLFTRAHAVGSCCGGWGPLYSTTLHYQRTDNEMEHFRKLLAILGIGLTRDDLVCELFAPLEEIRECEVLLAKLACRDFLVIHPGTGAPERRLPPALWLTAMECAPQQDVLVCGLGEDGAVADYLARHGDKRVFNLVGRLSIHQFHHVLGRARLIFTLESLAAHLASMTGVRTISFYHTRGSNHVQWQPVGGNVSIVEDLTDLPRTLRGLIG